MILENFASIKLDGRWKPRFWHSDSPAGIFPRGKDLRVSFCVSYKSRSRSREIAEKLPWRAFNPSFWAEPWGCKKHRRLVPKSADGTLSHGILSPQTDGIHRYIQIRVCTCVYVCNSCYKIFTSNIFRILRDPAIEKRGEGNGALAHWSVKNTR